MSLGLSHSLSRYKLRFSPDKVDTMVVQAIALLDDLDKELNTYAMRVREWYGWHFPEMTKVVSDNIAYARAIKAMGTRDRAAETDFSAAGLDDEAEAALKAAALVSMGTEISGDDLVQRVGAVRPGGRPGRVPRAAGGLPARAHGRHRAQPILGAEKALFRALKTKVCARAPSCVRHPACAFLRAPSCVRLPACVRVRVRVCLFVRACVVASGIQA